MAKKKAKGLWQSLKEYFGVGEHPMRPPVGWLLDRQLVTSLREILIFSAFGTRMDPRIWMVGKEFDCTRDFTGDELWFDYLSDSGDGMRATYSIAYLAYSDLFVPAGAAPEHKVAFEPNAEAVERLPRGAFLFVGGDTAYHVADYETLSERFQYPFELAFQHLSDLGKVDRKERRPIFGIPGNHDYYDFLDGFNRQFRRPFGEDHKFNPNKKGDQPQLVLGGFERKQWASFVSIELPFKWRMWGMDAEGGAMDRRQRHYFQSMLKDPEKPTDRLIVATPEPITKFGRRADPESAIVSTFRAIGLPCPFLDENPPEALPAGGCRLDLSGDVHHYARYWGAEPGAAQPAHYASVVSGLGGAFLHPSCTDRGEVPAAIRYPEPRTALAKVLRQVLNPWSIVLGGRVWLIGLLIAGFLFLGAATSASLRHAMTPLFDRTGLVLPALEKISPDTGTPEEKVKAADQSLFRTVVGWGGEVSQKALAALHTALEVKRCVMPGISEKDQAAAGVPGVENLSGAPSAFGREDACASPEIPILKATGPGHRWNRELNYIPILLLLVGWGIWRNVNLAKRAKAGEQIPNSSYHSPITLLVAASLVSMLWVFGHPHGDTQYGQLYPLASTLVVLAMLLLSFGGLLWSRQYDEAMNRAARAKGRLTISDQVHGWLLWAFTLLAALLGITRYGVDSLAVVSIDMAFWVVLFGILVGLPIFAAKVGGGLYGFWGRAGFALLGFWHALLQLTLPLLLVVALPWNVALAAGVATALVSWALGRLAPRLLGVWNAADRGRLGAILLLAWIAWTVGLVALTFAYASPQTATGASYCVALALGLILTCTFFGWYLAVSICFDGHNNEAGGGARIEQFKQFIRFRLTAEGLTGYVIAVDEVEEDGRRLKPRLVDVFEVRPS
ncbi:MAG: metallophosphoesterase [Acidobacteriota bacterium]